MSRTQILGLSSGGVHLMPGPDRKPGKAICGEWCSFAFEGAILETETVCERCLEIRPEARAGGMGQGRLM